MAGLIFKLYSESFGYLSCFRIYSGHIETGMAVYNANTARREHIGRILRMHANKREGIHRAEAGDIVALVG